MNCFRNILAFIATMTSKVEEGANQQTGKNGGGIKPAPLKVEKHIMKKQKLSNSTEKNIHNDKPLDSFQFGRGGNPVSLYEIEAHCHECDTKLDIRHLYEMFLIELHEEIEKLPLTRDSSCPNCKETKIIPSYQWGRYCKKCNYKLPLPFAAVSQAGSQAEDIVSVILEKFSK